MSAKTNYLEDKIIDHVLRNTSYTSPTTVYAALFTAAPGEAAGGTEVSGGSYARVAITFSAPSNGATANSGDVSFPTATADWGVVTHFAVFDDLTAGNMLYHGALAANKTISNGDTAKFATGQLQIAEL